MELEYYYVGVVLFLYVCMLAYSLYREHTRDWGENP